AAEAAVVEQYDRELEAERNGGCDLRVHHQIAAITHHHDYVAFRARELHAYAASDLVAHARVAVFEVIGVAMLRSPKLVQFAGQTACRAHHCAIFSDRAIHRAEHLGVSWAIDSAIFRGRVHLLEPLRA